MKWLKHMVDSGDDPDIDDAISLFGGDGYYVFFRTLEVMSREFDYENPGKNRFSVSFFRKKFRVSWRKTAKILSFFDQRKRIFFDFSNGDKLGEVNLFCPKLKGLCDEHTRKMLSKNSGVTQELRRSKSHTEAEAEAEAEADLLKADGASANKKIKDEIKSASSDLMAVCADLKYDFDAGKWAGEWIKKNGHPMAIVDSMNRLTQRLIDKSKGRIDKPYGYIEQIMKRINGNYWESENQKNSENLKACKMDGDLKKLISNIGR